MRMPRLQCWGWKTMGRRTEAAAQKKAEMTGVLQTILAELNHGQRRKLLENERVKEELAFHGIVLFDSAE